MWELRTRILLRRILRVRGPSAGLWRPISRRAIERGSHRWQEVRRQRLLAAAPRWGARGGGAAAARLVRQALEGHAWQADHVIPVFRGGGLCRLDNLRTLCTLCHQARPLPCKIIKLPFVWFRVQGSHSLSDTPSRLLEGLMSHVWLYSFVQSSLVCTLCHQARPLSWKTGICSQCFPTFLGFRPENMHYMTKGLISQILLYSLVQSSLAVHALPPGATAAQRKLSLLKL